MYMHMHMCVSGGRDGVGKRIRAEMRMSRGDRGGGAILRGAAVKEDVEIAPAVARIVLVDLPQLLGAHGCGQALRTHMYMCSVGMIAGMLCKRYDCAMVFAGRGGHWGAPSQV